MSDEVIKSLLGNPLSSSSGLAGLLGTPGYNPNAPVLSPTDRMMRPTPQVGLPDSQLTALAQPTAIGKIRQGVTDAAQSVRGGLLDYATGPYASQRLSELGKSLMTPSKGRPLSFGERLVGGLEAGSKAEAEKRATDLANIISAQELAIARGKASEVKKGSYPSTYVTPDRKLIETYFNPVRGERLVQGTDEPIPVGSIRLSELDAPKYQDMINLEDQLDSEKSTMNAVAKYIQDVKTAPEGIDRTISNVKTKLYTLMRKEGLTEKDLATARGRARLQGLIGQFRVDVVGPGVMTEQDAIRILIALGGDMSAFTPKAITLELLNDIKNKSENRYQSKATRFNKLLKTAPETSTTRTVFDPIELGESSDEAPKGLPDSSSGATEEVTMDMLLQGSK